MHYIWLCTLLHLDIHPYCIIMYISYNEYLLFIYVSTKTNLFVIFFLRILIDLPFLKV